MQTEKEYPDSVIRRKTIISFSIFIIFLISCIVIWKWLNKQPVDEGALLPLRKGLHVNELLFTGLFGERFAKSYAVSKAVINPRINGLIGIESSIDTSVWKLNVIKNNGDTLFLTMNDIRKLPKTEIVYDFKCIEGWDQVTHWAGVRFSDFINAYHLEKESQLRFTGLETPDEQYYVGIDNKSMLHPQTLLCYEINNKPLPDNQGAPLRLIIPVKYGVKNLKRIGTVFFSNNRPHDYWYERGYDYYCGL